MSEEVKDQFDWERFSEEALRDLMFEGLKQGIEETVNNFIPRLIDKGNHYKSETSELIGLIKEYLKIKIEHEKILQHETKLRMKKNYNEVVISLKGKNAKKYYPFVSSGDNAPTVKEERGDDNPNQNRSG